MIEGHLETLTDDGIVLGWVHDTGSPSPCQVQVLHEGSVIAEAMAATFRPDLLRAGRGHGHYGLVARLRRTLPPGRCAVAMHLPLHGRTAPMGLTVPRLSAARPTRVEALVASQPSWRVADLLGAPACLQADANRRRLGTARFVDAAYRFVLCRWPSKAEAKLHADNLDRGRVSPQDMLTDLLGSRERADLRLDLPSPFDDIFPFILA